MSVVSRHYVLAAGGTGGHLIPAFALAVELERRGHHIALVTDDRGAKIPGKPDFLPAHVLPAGRMTKNPLGWWKGLKGADAVPGLWSTTPKCRRCGQRAVASARPRVKPRTGSQ